MLYKSTRGTDKNLTFQDTVLMGLARDGGLILPEIVPSVASRLDTLKSLSYQELAFEIIRLFATDIPDNDLRQIINKSYSTFRDREITPVKSFEDLHILELFHGPTLAFKDLALQFLGNLFEYVLSKRGEHLNIVAATSGDTGSAAISGVRGRKNINIFVMHPYGRVSPVQALQMTSVLDSNVFNIAIDGTFDDCQAIVKTLFSDLEFRDKNHLGAVNSINWARVMAQIVYYFYAAFRVMERTGKSSVSFTVPTGNFGDVFAGYMAYKMGLPIQKLVIATNENNILERCFKTGDYTQCGVVPTLSPSMDIQIASNFERYLYYYFGENCDKTRQVMEDFKRLGTIKITENGTSITDSVFVAGSGNTKTTLATIKEMWEKYDYLIDPHTAVGVSVAKSFATNPNAPMICLSTAHPAKFGGAIEKALGKDIASHPVIEALKGAETRFTRLPADATSVASFVAKNI